MARRRKLSIDRIWAIRAGVAIGVGLIIGFATGVLAVRIQQASGAGVADSTAVEATPRSSRNRSAATPDAGANSTDGGPLAATDTAPRASRGTPVPKLVGLEEGEARIAISHAGFTVGSVMFKASSAPAGTVLSSFPVPGELVQLPATVNLILSDGHPRSDSLEVEQHSDPLLPTPHNLQ